MSKLILVRHGQSEWNLENRFTGWVDVDLSPKGKLEACKSGELIKDLKINLNYYFTSYQKRASETLKLILNTLRVQNNKIIKAWQLNERHYGSLTGLNKTETNKIEIKNLIATLKDKSLRNGNVGSPLKTLMACPTRRG